MGLFSMMVELVGISCAISGVRRSTGLSVMQLATSRIKNDNLRTATIGYLNLGEFVVDKGL
jgi:hypothetical protein